ncbi:hypothetical protein AZ78_4911 [Lysobacter capsici AZ78]|uniref:Uncharacterized protein n=1 Tax=Lysobacter capsici AZ78 TaxID=1444315 RepID=A0A108U448_9GAMM|nr:hypothetical protein AZ78_4911 [Lysobacter capsici AZ78]
MHYFVPHRFAAFYAGRRITRASRQRRRPGPGRQPHPRPGPLLPACNWPCNLRYTTRFARASASRRRRQAVPCRG